MELLCSQQINDSCQISSLAEVKKKEHPQYKQDSVVHISHFV